MMPKILTDEGSAQIAQVARGHAVNPEPETEARRTAHPGR